jgi:S1-C subfamily serine protease
MQLFVPRLQGGRARAATEDVFAGDTLVALDGTPVRQHDDVLGFLSPERIGTAVVARLIRGGQVQEQRVVVGEPTRGRAVWPTCCSK